MALELKSEVKAKIDKLAARYPRRQAALLPVLHLVQHEYGYLSPEVQMAVAVALDVPPTLVHEVTTFYEMYHQHPEGQFHLELCTNISCHLLGADQLVAHVKKELKIEVGHQTEDGVFSLMETECLASCGSGPMMRVGDDYYEYLTIPACDALIKKFREAAPSLAGKHYEHAPSGPHVGAVKGFEAPLVSLPTTSAPAAPAKTASAAPAAAVSAPTPAVQSPASAVPSPPAASAPSTDAVSQPPTAAALPSFDPPPLKKKDS